MSVHGDSRRRSRRPDVAAVFVIALLVGLTTPGGPVRGAASQIRLEIETPEHRGVVGDPGGMVFISGTALAVSGEYRVLDIVFVIDTSRSTHAPAGTDVDGDGVVGRAGADGLGALLGLLAPSRHRDPDDTVLAAELAAVRVLLEQLDSRTTRVGLVTFAGDLSQATPDAFTVVPLTSDYERVESGLQEILDRGPGGETNMAAGVRQGVVELLGTASARSERRDAQRIMLFMTDGKPTLPFGREWIQRNGDTAIEVARQAAQAGIRIDTYAIGRKAVRRPRTVSEIARMSEGRFTPVSHSRDLTAAFEQVSFTEIDTLEVRNQTTGEAATQLLRNADGTFSALVHMREGLNTVRVLARTPDGTRGEARLTLRFLEGGSAPPLSPRLVTQRNRLLRERLLELRRDRVELETTRDEELRRRLESEIADHGRPERQRDIEITSEE